MKLPLSTTIAAGALATEIVSRDLFLDYGALGVFVVFLLIAVATLYRSQITERKEHREILLNIVEDHRARMEIVAAAHREETTQIRLDYTNLVEKVTKIEQSR
jgi:hypothetical protein